MSDEEKSYDLIVEVSIRKSGTWRHEERYSSEVLLVVPPEHLRAFALADIVEACRSSAFRKLRDAEKAEAEAEAAETHDKAVADG